MYVADEGLWQQQRAELQADQISRDFLEFIETWVTQAEKLHSEYMVGGVAAALRNALEHAEAEHGRISIHFLGQMLVVILTHWIHGEELAHQLNPIELRLAQDMLALKYAELQRQAAQSDADLLVMDSDA